MKELLEATIKLMAIYADKKGLPFTHVIYKSEKMQKLLKEKFIAKLADMKKDCEILETSAYAGWKNEVIKNGLCEVAKETIDSYYATI